MTPAEYLKRPYGRIVVPESDGSFRAEIIEFPGCIAVGDTESKALSRLRDVAESWLESTIARKQRVPEPIESTGYSGKLVVRLPKSLHRKAAQQAARDGVSLNQFIVSSVAEQVGLQSVSSIQSQTFMTLIPAGFIAAPFQRLSSGGQQTTLAAGSSPMLALTTALMQPMGTVYAGS